MSMDQLLHRRAPIELVSTDSETRTVTVRLCRWNDVRTVADAGRRDREMFPPGALTLADRVYVTDSHHGELVGRALPDTFHDDGTGPCVDLVLADTARGRDLDSLLRAGVLDAVSIEYAPTSETRDADGVAVRTGVVHGVAFAFHPAHDAPVMALRDDPPTTTTTENTTMSDTTTMPDAPAVPAPTITEAVTPEVLTRSLDSLRDDITRELATITPAAPAGHPMLQHRSLAEYADAVWAGDAAPELLHRALADQITTNNPGVIPPAWISQVAGIIDRSRPTITAFGVSQLPPTGMEVDWPYFDGDLSALVGAQATEKTPITSVRVDIKKGSAPLDTYAGGSDISYQLIRRSSPAYRDAYLRIMMSAYSVVTNHSAGLIVTAGSTASSATFDPATGTGEDLLAALFTASTEVEAATGAPAGFAVAATDVFVAIGAGLGGAILPAQYGTQNLAGTADAATLSVNVSGLRVFHDASLAAGTFIVSNSEAGTWYEDGPAVVAAEDVEKLGQNVAVWGMGTFAPVLPAGIRKINAA